MLAHLTPGSKRELGNPGALYLPFISVRKPASGASNLIFATRPFVSTFTGLPGACAIAWSGCTVKAIKDAAGTIASQDVSPFLFVAGNKDLPAGRDEWQTE